MYILVLSFYLFEITNLYNKSIHDIPTGIFFIQHKRFPKRDKKAKALVCEIGQPSLHFVLIYLFIAKFMDQYA